MKKEIKQEQWIMLPADKAENSIITNNGTVKKMLSFEKSLLTQSYLKSECKESHHLYLTSDEEIKVGDWCIDVSLKRVFQVKDEEGFPLNTVIKSMEYLHKSGRKFWKIIATTDKSLSTMKAWDNLNEIVERKELGEPDATKSLIPLIPESFIKHYVEKQGKVGDVEVEYAQKLEKRGHLMHDKSAVIDIVNTNDLILTDNNEIIVNVFTEEFIKDFEGKYKGKKMYSKEEVAKLIAKYWLDEMSGGKLHGEVGFAKWIEQNL